MNGKEKIKVTHPIAREIEEVVESFHLHLPFMAIYPDWKRLIQRDRNQNQE